MTLRNKKIRVLHSLSFVDDPTRMLRAVRFEQRFGFTIEPRTLLLLNEARSLLNEVSGERIRHEIDQILLEKRPSKGLNRLADLDLLTRIHPAILWDNALNSQFNRLFGSGLPKHWQFPDHPAESPAESPGRVYPAAFRPAMRRRY